MKTTIHPVAIYRVPRFPVNAQLKESWKDLKDAIKHSSNDFYNIIKNVEADKLDQLPPPVKATIWKYFNRAKFRATPYGVFAGFGLTEISFYPQSGDFIIEKEFLPHHFLDWSEKDKLIPPFTEVVEKDELLFANTSYYRMNNSIRYLFFENGMFELSEVPYSKDLEVILSLCAKPIKVSELSKHYPHLEALTLRSEIEYLISIQLLMHSGMPNIIGKDYFQSRDANHEGSLKDYILAESKPYAGSLNAGHFKHISALIDRLRLFKRKSENTSLESFISRFTRKFEQKQVPIMLALDPEAGVGYGDLEQSDHESELITRLSLFTESPDEDRLHKQINGLLMQQVGNTQRSIDFEQLTPPYHTTDGLLPNTLSAMCLIQGERLQLENVGGATANALNGRFTLASEEIRELCVELAGIEQKANPDVAFFDVAYIAESGVDNINRRKQIFPLQLSLLNYDTSENPLTLTDLYLSVRGNELLLHSKKLGKRLIPRVGSAYNYLRSDLSLFRLLCDLQHQNLLVNLNLSLPTIAPGLDYYPELRFRNIILSPRTWRLDSKSLDSLSGMKKYIASTVDCRFVRTGRGDQTLTFDVKAQLDQEILYQELTKESPLLIEEYCLPATSSINDIQGRPYAGQVLLNIVHTQNLYRPITLNESKHTIKVQEIFPPSKQWLYFEIYCHPSRANELLLDKLSTFLKNNSRLIHLWFFIRYNENGNHLRLRIKLSDTKAGYQLTSNLTELLKDDLHCGIVSDLRIAVYRRELARYGSGMIEQVERHFCSDSRFVMALLSNNPGTFTKYKLCINLYSELIRQEILPLNNLFNLAQETSLAYNKEHQVKPEDFKKVNSAYKQYLQSELPSLNAEQMEAKREFECSFIQTVMACPIADRENLIVDLIHMHINRMFADHQRSHEMICYYFLHKDLLRERTNA